MAETLVELTHSERVFVWQGSELIRLDRQRIALTSDDLAAAHRETLERGGLPRGGFRFGFLLGVDAEQAGPAARRVIATLEEGLVAPVGRCRGSEFELSFLKAAEGNAQPSTEGPLFDGFHLDTHPELLTDSSRELLRVLVNLSCRPRTLRFLTAPRWELAEEGCDVSRESFRVDPPPTVGEDQVVLPGFDAGSISYLTFWASRVPHVGLESPEGHFLASFETVVEC